MKGNYLQISTHVDTSELDIPTKPSDVIDNIEAKIQDEHTPPDCLIFSVRWLEDHHTF